MNLKIWLILGLAGLLSACPAPAATPAALTVTITGNPSVTAPSVTVTGPNGYSQTLSTTTTLTNLEAGAYSVTASAFESANLEYAASIGGSPATIAAGANVSITVTYAKSATLVSSLADSGAGSLRDAIAAAPAGETLKFSSATTGVVALSSELGIAKNLTLAGTDVTLSGGNANRVLNISSGATVTVQGLKLTGGKSITITSSGVRPQGFGDGKGGVIHNAGTLLLRNTEVSSGEADVGGGVFNATGATLILEGGSIKGNKASGLGDTQGYGGGVYNAEGAMFTIISGSIEGNSAARLNGGVSNGGTLVMDGGAIKQNTTLYAGGGVGTYAPGTFTMNGGSIESNETTFVNPGQSGSVGGGVYARGPFTMNNGTIKNNSVRNVGGGVMIDDGSSFTMKGGVIEGNSALGGAQGQAGGGVFNYKGTFRLEGGTIKGNTALEGGGVALSTTTQNFFSGGVIEGNTANKNGGGLRVSGNSSAEISGTTLKANIAQDSGGGLLIGGSVVMSGTAAVLNNTAVNGGGGIRMYSSGKLQITGGNIQANSSRFAAGVQFDGPYNGDTGSSLKLEGGTIQNNVAVDASGGLGGGGTFTFSGGAVRQNAAKYGAGVDLYENGVLTMTGGVIQLNTATENGGGVKLSPNSTFTLENGVIEGNSARSGGGIHLHRGTVNFKGGTVRGNTTTQFCGGGIAIGGDVTTKGVLNFSGGSIENNTVADVGGGVCVYQYGSMVMSGGAVRNNIAPQSGGGISVGANGTLTLENGLIENNTAALFGGGVQMSNSVFTMKGGAIRGNTVTSESGGGINLFDASSFTMTGGVIESNKATAVGRNGGGIHVGGSLPIVTIKDGMIRNNQAENFGGGIATYQAKVIMEGGTISGNSAKNGGGVSVDGDSSFKGSFALSGGTITGNTATVSGGGIFTIANSVLTRTGGTVSSNTPQDIFPTP